jgi:FkbM family methyltransferase
VPLRGEEELLRCDDGFSIAGDNPASRAHKPFTPSGHVTLHTVQLDAFALKNDVKSISFLKVDVEGFDTFVMEGAEQLFKSHMIQRAVVEVTSHMWGVPFEQVRVHIYIY